MLKVKTAAIQCLVKVVGLYYPHLDTYMCPALTYITLEAMKSSVTKVEGI